MPFRPDRLRGIKPTSDLIDAKTGKVAIEAGRKVTARLAKKLADEGLKELLVSDEDLHGRYLAQDIVNMETGEIYGEAGEELDAKLLATLKELGLKEIPILDIDHVNVGAFIRNTLNIDKNSNPEEALLDIYRVMRPGEPPTPEAAADAVQRHLLRFRALRPLGRRPRQDEHASRPRRARHGAHAAQRGHPRRDQDAGRLARRQGRDRRHRPSRQPPGALGRRADGESVSRRPVAHGARHQGAHELGRYRHGDAAGPDQRQAGGRRGARVLRLLAAVAVHGPDQSAVGDHAQAASVGAWPGRPHARARRLRGARRASDALRPHLPDRDAGRPEYRPDQLARDLRAGEQIRLHREPVSPRGQRQGDRRGGLSLGHGGGALHHRPGQRQAQPERHLHRGPGRLPSRRRRRARAAGEGRSDRRVAEAARVGRRRAHSVPRERRRQPRADGLQHAASGGAADHGRSAAGRHRHGGGRGARFRRRHRRPPHRRGRSGGRDPYRHPRHGGDRSVEVGRRHLQSAQVPALEPEHLHQPAAAGARGRSGPGGRDHRRRSVDRSRRAGARPERARRLHAVDGLQLRGLHPHLRARRARRRVHLDPYRGVRGDGPRHQARAGGDHPRHSRTSRKRRSRTSTRRASSISAPR